MSLTPEAQAPLVGYLDQCQIRLQEEPLELDTLKLQFVLLLQQTLLAKDSLNAEQNIMTQLESVVLNIY